MRKGAAKGEGKGRESREGGRREEAAKKTPDAVTEKSLKQRCHEK